MAAFNVWQRNITDASTGIILEGAQITVANEQGGAVSLFADENGATPKPNPFLTGIDGLARFFAAPGFYKITAFKSGVGTQEFVWENVGDKSLRGDLNAEGGAALVRLSDGKTVQEYSDQFTTVELDAAIDEARSEADRAETYRDEAQQARDDIINTSVLASANIYETTTLGLANSNDGDVFWVYPNNLNSIENLTLFKRVDAMTEELLFVQYNLNEYMIEEGAIWGAEQ